MEAISSTLVAPTLYDTCMFDTASKTASHRPYLRVIIIVVSTLACGCAHYGWSGTGTTLDVETVGVRADEGLVPSELTRRLVLQLQRDGIDAKWNGDSGPTLVCKVSVLEAAASALIAPEAEATCALGDQTLTARGASAATTSNDIGRSVRSVQQRAAEAAIDAIALEVGRALHPTEND